MNEIARIERHPNVIEAAKPMTAGEIQNQVNVIQHVMKQVMKQNTHYGVIPGCKEPSLYKPGAEKIMATFRLSADPEVTDLSDEDQIRYQVKVRLISPSGVFVGAGIGECSSNEEKYKWRAAVCKEEFEETEPGRRREKWRKGYQGKPNWKMQQVRTEPADLANTILKMAKKRALIDAVLTATAASDCFTQDIEDLPPEYIDGQEPQAPAENLPDITDALLSIAEADSMEALQTAFTEAWKQYTHKTLRQQLTTAKDKRKKELSNA
jgi:hypothetical protein